MHSFTIGVHRNAQSIQLSDVQGNTQRRHLQNGCAGKHPEYTSLRLISRDTPRVHIFKVDVQGNTQSTHL